ncbi:MAG: hypothetical protein EZS28_055816, partial [Streblomastix strix]
MDAVMEQPGPELDNSGIALFILSVGCGMIVAAILTSTVKGVGCK